MIDSHNLLAWAAQSIVLASAAALLPLALRLRHPRTQLAYCHLALAACLIVPIATPRIHPTIFVATSLTIEPPALTAPRPATITASQQSHPAPPRIESTASAPILPSLPWIFAAGIALRLCWTLAGLYQIRRYRIAATPLHPVPDSIHAAGAVTHADALFCVSPDIPGPVMLGWLAPVVLLPERFAALDDEAQCGIACHELLHVKRGDWLATLCEELAAAVLWFNPAAWLLLAQTRLAREQLVDAETVRLTASRDTYIDALLAIARGGQTLDLVPAPLFLRRRHLTHRMHSLLKEVPMPKWRLLSSYSSIAGLLALAGWFACISFPLTGRAEVVTQPAPPIAAAKPGSDVAPATKPDPVIVAFEVPQRRGPRPVVAEVASGITAPIPPDPHEPATASVRPVTDPGARADLLSLLERARENGLTHRAGTPPYRLEANFTAAATSLYAGSGQLVETWLTGQSWRWTANLGGYSVVRAQRFGSASGEKAPGAIPMRVHMVRNALFWAIPKNLPQQIRSADVQWNGKPATCLLFSGIVGATDAARLWEEEEYCIDRATGTLQMHSIAPGTYTVYSYGRNVQFHGRATPDHVVVYCNGNVVLDAQVTLTDAGSVDDSQLRPTPEMLARGPVAGVDLPARFPMDIPSTSVSVVKPVMVHASVDGAGNVLETEISASSDPALTQAALDAVRNAHFGMGVQRQMYINVKFIPQGR